MGAIFAIILLVALLSIGMIGIGAGIVGLMIGRKRKRAGKSFSRALTIVFAIVLSISIVVAIIPIGFFSFIVIVNSLPPEGFVETEIIIEENGYQDTKFTADGVIYEVLDFQVYDADAICNPIFTYQTKGLLNGSQCGNYYAIDNSQGFRLISDNSGHLFVPVEEKELVVEYYTNVANVCGYYDDWDEREFKLSDDENAVVQDFLSTDIELLHQEKIVLDDAEKFEIKLICTEGIIHVESHWFLIFNDELYYIADSDFAEDHGILYTLIELPHEIADTLLEMHKSG